MKLWHKRLVHISISTLCSLQKLVDGISKLFGNLPTCHPCRPGKAYKKYFNSHFEHVNYDGDVVHTDLSASPPTSLTNCEYLCMFTDQHFRFTHVACNRYNSIIGDAIEAFKDQPIVQKYFKMVSSTVKVIADENTFR